MTRRPPTSTPFPSTTLFRSHTSEPQSHDNLVCRLLDFRRVLDRKSTRLNSSHTIISYAVFCLKKKRWARYDVRRSAEAHHPLRRGSRQAACFRPHRRRSSFVPLSIHTSLSSSSSFSLSRLTRRPIPSFHRRSTRCTP